MPTSNEQYQDRIISHQIGLRRLSNATVRRVIAMLNRTRPDVQRLLSERLARIEERGFDLGPATTARLQQLDIELQGILRESHQMIVGAVNSDMEALARYEPEYQSKLLNDVLPVNLEMVRPSAQTLQAIVYSQPFQGRVLKDWTDQFVANDRRRIMDAIRMGMVEGETPTQIVRRVEGTKALRYKDGVREVSRRGLQTLVQTASSHVANRARQAWAMESGVVEVEVFVATLDSKTSLQCASLDGRTFPVGKGPTPPLHMNCLPGDSLVSAGTRVTGATKRWFDGDLVVIRTARGRKLSVTPNHPILTQRGWIGAQFVNNVDKVIDGVGIERKPLPCDNKDNDMVARIEDVAESFFASGDVVPVPMPVTAPDFHGDGTDGDVAVVATNSFLRDAFKAPLFEREFKPDFVRASVCFSELPSFGSLNFLAHRVFSASNSLMRGFSKSFPFFSRSPVHSGLLLLRSVSDMYAVTLKPMFDYARRTVKGIGYAAKTDALGIHFFGAGYVDIDDGVSSLSGLDSMLAKDALNDVFGNAKISSGGFDSAIFPECGYDGVVGDRAFIAAPFNSGHVESLIGESKADIELAGNLLSGHSGKVEFDDIVSIDRVRHVGHVYNLECEEPWFLADGLIIHNCRSSRAPAIDGKLVGERPANAVTDKELEGLTGQARKDKIRELVGPVPAETSFNDWLKRQSPEFVDDYLGKTRAELFRQGKVTMKDLVDRNGQPWSLQELAAREGVKI